MMNKRTGRTKTFLKSDKIEKQPEVDVNIPTKLLPFLNTPKKIKVAYGGRNGGKSWALATMALLKGVKEPLRILCVREVMVSMKDSVHELLRKQIVRLKLQDFYTVEKGTIYGLPMKNIADPNEDPKWIPDPTGERTEFIFKGIKKDVDQIRSTEGVHITWVEEAHSVSKNSWRVLLPTIFRRSIDNGDSMDSELWLSFNPHYEEDETYQRFVKNPRPGESMIVKIDYTDLYAQNPNWIPKNVLDEIEYDRQVNPDEFDHIWLGACKRHLEGAVYEKELRMADREGFIKNIEYDPNYTVEAFWDMGRKDNTSIWIAQRCGMFIHVIDFIEDQSETIEYYANMFQFKPYKIDIHWMPHDAGDKKQEHKWSLEEQLRNLVEGHGTLVKVIPRMNNIEEGINAVRTLFPVMRFDEVKCEEGLNHIKKYAWEVYVNKDGQKSFSDKPKHDEHSHCADALRYMAIALKPKKIKKLYQFNQRAATINTSRDSWMSL